MFLKFYKGFDYKDIKQYSDFVCRLTFTDEKHTSDEMKDFIDLLKNVLEKSFEGKDGTK
jgi:hypothetical protein